MTASNNPPSVIEFPCYFPIKVVGPAGGDFEALTLGIVRKHIPDLSEAAVTSRLSKDGNYQAMTITVHATSQTQLDAVYRELSAAEKIIMVL
jgi:putative lipoic acid-binding regulatory protein